jgi:sporulation protein YlmC with PRC-barrel domain
LRWTLELGARSLRDRHTRVELGASVRTSDGEDIGTIDKLILDPKTREVKSAAVHKPFLVPDDVEIPIEAMQPGTESDIRLGYTADRAKELPRFVEVEYTTVPADYPVDYGYPAGGLLWPVEYPMYPAPAPYPGVAGPTPGPVYDRATQGEIAATQRERACAPRSSTRAAKSRAATMRRWARSRASLSTPRAASRPASSRGKASSSPRTCRCPPI